MNSSYIIFLFSFLPQIGNLNEYFEVRSWKEIRQIVILYVDREIDEVCCPLIYSYHLFLRSICIYIYIKDIARVPGFSGSEKFKQLFSPEIYVYIYIPIPILLNGKIKPFSHTPKRTQSVHNKIP